jgi:hypothetical protein
MGGMRLVVFELADDTGCVAFPPDKVLVVQYGDKVQIYEWGRPTDSSNSWSVKGSFEECVQKVNEALSFEGDMEGDMESPRVKWESPNRAVLTANVQLDVEPSEDFGASPAIMDIGFDNTPEESETGPTVVYHMPRGTTIDSKTPVQKWMDGVETLDELHLQMNEHIRPAEDEDIRPGVLILWPLDRKWTHAKSGGTYDLRCAYVEKTDD